VHRHRSATLISAVLLASCAGAGSRDAYTVSFRASAPSSHDVLPYPPELVWSVLPLAYGDLGLPGGENRTGGGREWMTPQLRVRDQLYGRRNSAFIHCGTYPGGPLEDGSEVTIAIVTRLEPAAGGTTVRTQVDAYARRRDVAADPVSCASRGVLERAIVESLRARLREGEQPRR
jgi:hypothetical protein